MAEYYTLFCEKLDLRTSQEYEWLKQIYAWAPSEDGGMNLKDMDAEIQRVKEELGFELSYEDFDAFPEHQYELTSESLRVYSEEDLSTGTVSRIIQGFLRKFRPDECFSITWAFTCSKTWVGEFGGGAVFITADKIENHNVRDFISQKEQNHQKNNQLVAK